MNTIKESSGFTLIEIIIAIAILGLIAAAMLSMFSFSIETVFSMGDKTTATKIAQDFMDAHYGNSPLSVNGDPAMPVIDSHYTMTRTVSALRPDGTHLVTITVQYRNNTRSVELTALVP